MDEGGEVVDSSKLSKRVFFRRWNEAQRKPVPLLSEMGQSEGAVFSTHAMMQRLPGSVNGFEVVVIRGWKWCSRFRE